MKRALLLTLATVAIALPQDKQARGKQIIDATLAALGGERFLRMQDRVETGRAFSFYRERMSGLSRATIYTRYLTRPEPPVAGFIGQRERQSFGKDEASGAVLFTENEGWQITYRGASPVLKDLLERYQISLLRNIFYILRMRLGEKGLLFELDKTDIVDNQPVEILYITDSDNREVTVHIHRSTHLPVRQVYYRRNPISKERMEEVTVFGKYRDVGGGVQWPYSIQRFRDGEKLFELYADSVVINQGLTDTLFSFSTDMKILKPPR